MCCKRINIYKSKHECGINWCNLCREKHDTRQNSAYREHAEIKIYIPNLCCEHEIGREIIHAGRVREFMLLEGFRVDSYLPPENDNAKGIVFEYRGCYTRGCSICFNKQRDKIMSYGRTMDESYENTFQKIKKIKALGYEVREIWECTFDRIKAENREIYEYVTQHPLMSRITLNPRFFWR
ncbi:hypothetical protein TSAR_001382 [Trichomalopsis sarcophagae]|uniref:Uncharacterized protein n=1 Tax=Trichomalopsis sarcophagae TaxID=543379 RepID=A0A232EFY4_9HYME|nr:hypothetical protein TSAR_001382 [Trichomalopsis sarcophagae]